MPAVASSASTPRPTQSPIERGLGIFTQVRAGEGNTALLMLLNGFLLLTAYYVIKPVREAFILQGGETQIFGWTVGKAELKSYASAGMAVVLVGVVAAYGRLASAVARQKLITFVTLFFISNLVVFYVLAQRGVTAWLGVAFFLWMGIFNVMVVAQFWSFANDIYTPEEGKRLFPILGFGVSAGAALGAKIAGWIIGLGEAQLLLVAAAILGLCIALSNSVHQREKKRRDGGAVRQTSDVTTAGTVGAGEAPIGRSGGFELLFQQPYLMLIALLMLLANLVNTTGEFILGRKVAETAAEAVASGQAGGLSEGQYIGKFYSDFYFVVNILGLALQMFVVSRILKYLGVRIALMVLPLIALGGYVVLAFGASLTAIRFIKTLENSTDYSLQSTTRNVLFLPTSRAVKYKAKAAIDTFFVRIGDLSSALLVFFGTRAVFDIERFALVNAVFVVLWLAVAVGVVRHYRTIMARVDPVRPSSAD